MKLSTKLTGIVALQAVVVSMGCGILANVTIRSLEQKAIGREQQQVARQVLSQIDQLLYQRSNEIKAMASDEEFQGSLAGRDTFDESRTKMEKLSFLTGPWDILSLVDTKGDIVLSTAAKEIGQNISAYAQSALAHEESMKGESYFSDAIISLRSGKPTIIFSAPLRDDADPEQAIIGTIIGQMSWPVITDRLQSDIPKDAEAHLFTQDGTLIDASDTDEDHTFFQGKFREFDDAKARAASEEAFILKADEGFIETETLASIAYESGFLNYTGNGWGLALERPVSVALAPARDAARRISVLLTLIILPLSGLLFWTLSRLVIRPIALLTTTAHRISRGHMDSRAQVTSNDEIGLLGQAFNDMVSKLQASVSSLKKQSTDLETSLKIQQEQTGKLTNAKTAMLNVLEDLQTAKKQVEEEAKNARKFQQAVEGSTDAIAITLPDLTYVYVNPAWEHLTGFSKEDTKGKSPVTLLISPTLDPLAKDALVKAIGAGETFHSEEFIYRRKNGTDYDAEVTLYPITEKQQVLFYVILHHDVTQRKRVEAAKSDFVSLASHQLRTPITALRLALETLLKGIAGPMNDMQTKIAEHAQTYAIHLSETVSALLYVSRVESGSLKIEPDDVVIQKILDEVSDEQRLVVEAQKQTLSINCPDGLTIGSDRKLLKEILSNLVSNAVKYTPPGGKVTVTVSEEKDKVSIDVSDTGMGIPTHLQSRIFTKFFRADNAQKKKTDGTGLGLYLVSSLTRIIQGTISFTSEENKGSTFTLLLPHQL